jgi:glutamyl-tRNA(Gln) amidotransferase subunit E
MNESKIVHAVTLKGYKNLLNWQTQTETYFSKEISDRVRVIACLSALPNIIHSDSAAETISIAEWQKVKKTIGASEKDTVVIVWGPEVDVITASKEIAIRAKEATIGVPSETRQAQKDGTTGFERILPGPERMYPDTDLPPKRITEERKERIKAQLPEIYWENEKWYRELKVPADLIEPLAVSRLTFLFKKAVSEWKINPKLAAVVLIQYPKRLRKMKIEFEKIDEEVFSVILKAYSKGLVEREGILPALVSAVRQGIFDSDNLPPILDNRDITEIIQSTDAELKRNKIHNPGKCNEILTGAVMDKVRGRIKSSTVINSTVNYSKESENV